MKNDSVNEKYNNCAQNCAVTLKKGEGGMAFSLFMLLYFVVSLLVQGVMLIFGAVQGSPVFNIIPPFVICLTTFGVLALFCLKKGENSRSLCRAQKFSPFFAVLSVTTALGLLFGLGFVNGLVAELFEKIGLKIQTVSLEYNGVWLFVAYVSSLAIVPALLEEMVFRGVIFGKSIKCGTVFAVIFSSLAFALYHCSVTQFIYQFLCGIVFCLLAYYSGSAITSAIAHFTNNFCVLLLSYLGLDGKIDFYSAPVILVGLSILTASVVLTIITGKFLQKDKASSFNDEKKRVKEGKSICKNGETHVVPNGNYIKSEKAQERIYFFIFSSVGFAICLAILITGLFSL